LEATYSTIKGFCADVDDKAAREQCWIGAGDTAGQRTDWNVEVILGLCALLGSEDANYACRIGAAGAFFSEVSHRERAPEFCRDADRNRKATCLARMRSDPETPTADRLTQ
jgi:hypothetical protein